MSALTKKIAKNRSRAWLDKQDVLGPIIHEIQDKVDVHDLVIAAFPMRETVPTVPTTAGTLEVTFICPAAGTLAGARVAFKDALAADDTNYVTYAIKNKSNSNADMLSTAAVNTTKATGGSAMVAYTSRALTLNGTAANLKVNAGDVLVLQFVGAGTLNNTLTEGTINLLWNFSS